MLNVFACHIATNYVYYLTISKLKTYVCLLNIKPWSSDYLKHLISPTHHQSVKYASSPSFIGYLAKIETFDLYMQK